jgi:hypothetical protein
MDLFLLLLTIIASVLLLIASIYILAYYTHPEDKGFGSGCINIICKFAVVLLVLYRLLEWH